ncbi:hypothetical protein [Streptomyces rhizosphaericola]|uniref:Uncharacterized protein n=1 Tax=Streptomyces rhizosphaericola TaxID=2564098 RepID=A0ABY2PGV1_9ACTN|nr:hypothetical protein [Streptomyces rhizosphaericola]TGZ10255.1 hypothetical protein E5Z02_10810 [Streptomyces rhizosphaericola]
MTPLEELLSRALLVRDRTVPRDIVPPRNPEPSTHPAVAPDEASVSQHPAAEDLRALCETLVTHTPATAVAGFVTDQVPEPRSALILACVLQLTDTDAGARFWWQYAAGAGQPAAAYCLYLHHLSLGEEDTATWWRSQMDEAQHRPVAYTCDYGERLDAASTATMLRVLHHLARHTDRRPSSVVTGLMTYMPIAVAEGYLREPDTELPLPGPEFARTVRTLLTTVANCGSQRLRDRPDVQRRARRQAEAAQTVKANAARRRAQRNVQKTEETANG